MPPDVGVVIVAAGMGTRLGGTVPKQFRLLGGVPVLLRALRPFVSHPAVLHTLVVLPAPEAASPPAWLAELLGGGLSVVAGGAERHHSVARGLAALPAACTTVLVHDAARPLVSREIIDAVVDAARQGQGVVPAIPLGDTLKEAGTDLVVRRTIPRDHLWRVQTPQGFPRVLLEEGHARAHRAAVTDDAMLLEQLGVPVRVVPGSPRNLKITTEDDFQMAERLL